MPRKALLNSLWAAKFEPLFLSNINESHWTKIDKTADMLIPQSIEINSSCDVGGF